MKVTPTEKSETYAMDFPGDMVTQEVLHAIATYYGEAMLHRSASAFFLLAYHYNPAHGGLVDVCRDEVSVYVSLFVEGFLGGLGSNHIPYPQKMKAPF